MTDPEESRLIQQAQKGDVQAFNELLLGYQDLVAGTAYGWLGDLELARDVTQEVFLAAHRNLGQLREPDAFPGWLRRIVVKQCDRVTRRRTALTTSMSTLTEESVVSTENPQREAEESEAIDQLRFAVEGLPVGERQIIALHYFAEATGPELAEYLELPLSTVKKRLRRARARLKDDGDRMMKNTMDRLRPSRSGDLSREVRFFISLRAGDRVSVARLLQEDRGLVNARQSWEPELVLEGLLPFANQATALITAVELDDLDMLHLLLEAGADPDAPSSSGSHPLHLAAMRGYAELVDLLLVSGADTALVDEGPRYPRQFVPAHGRTEVAPRTAEDWALANGHRAIAARLQQANGHRSAPSPASASGTVQLLHGQVYHTGIKALDLFAPLKRGGIVRVPFKAGVGMVVLLGELCRRFCAAEHGAAIWTGFAQPPFDLQDWQAEMAEFGLEDQVAQRLASFSQPAEERRAAFAEGVELARSLRDQGGEVLVIVQSTEGFGGDVDAGLLRLSEAHSTGSITTLVMTDFPERDNVWSELRAPYSGQLTLDRRRAKAYLFPALDPGACLSGAETDVLGERHLTLAGEARSLLAAYVEQDPDFAELGSDGAAAGPALLRYLCQPFFVTEPFTGRQGEWVERSALLDEVEGIIRDQKNRGP